MLKAWLNADGDHSWKVLVDALRSQSVEKNYLARVLEEKFMLLEITEEGSSTSASNSQPETSVIPPPVSEPVVPKVTPQSAVADIQESKWNGDINRSKLTDNTWIHQTLFVGSVGEFLE